MAAIIHEGVSDGSIRADIGDPMLTGINLWGFTHGLIQLAAQKGDMLRHLHHIQPDAVIDHGFHVMMRALAATPPG
jgi:hypothetical protein